MEECHKLLTDKVDDAILQYNVSKPLPLGRKIGRPALSISKMKAAFYPDVDYSTLVTIDQFWIEEEQSQQDKSRDEYKILDEERRGQKQGVHVRYPETAKDTTYLPESGKLCWWTDSRRRLPVNTDDPNITMEEYIRLEEEKSHRRGKVYNWETTTYGKIWHDEDVHDLRSVETKFPAIVFNDELTSEEALPCKPTVSPLNDNQIDFRISFDESDDEDYTVIYDKNSFSYKIIFVNNLKIDLENDNDKVNMPSFPSPEPVVNYSNDLGFFKDFENAFPSIVYNDALTFKSDFLTEPTISPQHIDEFNLKDETSLSECDEE
ncbi:hypothetical protein Tco_1004176 [Tanacetum coccineum]|uniref:Uncharacterized protein n=1 Tax=Tanacetum coccineum TaxID=301880 RepID=A0ABQ5FB50_9ASTR